ncbi:DUF3413 domain-containing protein [Psittacicella hinzii]|uniref:Inner membrane protein YejM N-terminal domain-containing protein n=1 Tax=Psittacicella hinzii TaxID=2028575 RepID=A0A3A1YM02_9GAMM|nr:DUF3413 domain-containing protein [Psittacicella hinzii]RIY39192.1 hypothetical protein CKF58_02680 [Psittacicella hinzii]
MHILLNSTQYLTPSQRRIMNLRWAYWFVLCNLVIFWLLGLRYISGLHIHNAISMGYFLATNFSHFFLLSLISLVIPILVVFIIKNDFYYRLVVATYYTLLISLLMLDQAVYNIFYEHLRWINLVDLLLAHARYQVDFVNVYFIAIPFILLFEVLFSAYIWRRILHLHFRSKFTYIFFFLMLICICWSNSLYIYAMNTDNVDILKYRSVFPLMFYFTPDNGLDYLP